MDECLAKPIRVNELAADDYAKQYARALRVRDATSTANEAVIRIREMKKNLPPGDKLAAKLTEIEGQLYQIKNQSPKDKIANAIKLNDRLAGALSIVGEGAGAPTAPQQQVAIELKTEFDALIKQLNTVL